MPVRLNSANGGSVPLNPCRHIVNAVRTSVWVAMQTKPADLVADQLAKKVSESAVKNAKHDLWMNADHQEIRLDGALLPMMISCDLKCHLMVCWIKCRYPLRPSSALN